jgi:hypothetical protein
VQLERLSVELRPRGGWESIDLGFQMAHRWWRPVWGVWLAVFVPVAAALHFVFHWSPLVAALVLWWLKPVFDRFVLHVVSRAVFGSVPTVRETLADWREILTPGLAAALTVYRLQPARSAMLPAWQLERQTGRAAADRRRTLGRRLDGGVGATIVCVHFEAVIFVSVALLGSLLEPASANAGFEFSELFRKAAEDEPVWWDLYDSLYYVIAVSIVEPLYVAAGFALYLNRRAILEGWDIELQLRRLDQRLRAAVSAGTLALVLGLGLGLAASPPAAAQGKSARDEVREVLKAPEFQEYKESGTWAYRGKRSERKPTEVDLGFWAKLGQLLASIQEFVLWTLAALAVIGLVYLLQRWMPRWLDAPRAAYRPPDALFGLALAPESLPDDVAAAAAALVREGRLREALSLLYRGALSVLVHRNHVALAEGDTEGDCVRAARKALPENAAEYFARLVQTWTGAAYAGRLPDAARAESLCRDWAPHFGPQASPAR